MSRGNGATETISLSRRGTQRKPDVNKLQTIQKTIDKPETNHKCKPSKQWGKL